MESKWEGKNWISSFPGLLLRPLGADSDACFSLTRAEPLPVGPGQRRTIAVQTTSEVYSTLSTGTDATPKLRRVYGFVVSVGKSGSQHPQSHPSPAKQSLILSPTSRPRIMRQLDRFENSSPKSTGRNLGKDGNSPHDMTSDVQLKSQRIPLGNPPYTSKIVEKLSVPIS